MKIHSLSGPPSREMAGALADFEREFRYPLGPGETFSISHGADYTLFFRSMGDARIHLAEISGRIVGAIAVVGREVLLADGSKVPAAYICDAKVVAELRCRTVLGRLAIAANRDAAERGFVAGFAIAMTGSIPSDAHSGRLGIPHFRKLGELAILRFGTAENPDAPAFRGGFGNQSHHRLMAGNPAMGSEIAPLALEAEGACGTLVDTRLGKRLWKSDATEMLSAHLTDLRFSSAHGLSELIRRAREAAAGLGFPGVFLALPADFPRLEGLAGGALTIAGAGIYGTGLPEGSWMVNTSEI